MEPISVLLVDDHTLFRDGLASLLRTRPTVEVVGGAADGEEALRLARELLPDLVLMDVRMSGMGGLEATRRLKAELPEVKVVMLTMSEDDQDLFESIKAGAQGYILKNTPAEELFGFIERVFAGQAPISGLMAAKMLGEFARPSALSGRGEFPCEKLSDREREVLQRVAEGASNREIAMALSISENTVKKHLRNILAKLHLRNRVEAAVYAVQRGLAEVDT
ncbi:MAG TPA: response regulator transcription factor [Anaerolineae bacterium]|nr:response regulator transcription factor [Anaerolineae bacterium]HIQ06239.1 response regulator transcription factor [Anaerolineae bacterium]